LPLKHILIAAPTMAGLMKAKTATSLIMLMRQLTRAGVQAEYLNIDSSDIVYARNFFARRVLEAPDLDGLLFVDSDMQFRPAVVLRMLQFEQDVVGVAYPKRALDFDQYSRAMAEEDVFTPETKGRALANTYQFTLIPSWETPRPSRFKIVRGFAKMAAVGMGCTLISRAGLEAMIEGKVVERRKDIIDGEEQISWGFFDTQRVGDLTLSEDFSFCYRWTRQLGRELWVLVDEPITHLGDWPHRARYLDRLSLVRNDPSRSAPPTDTTPIVLDVDNGGEADAPTRKATGG